MPRRIVTARGKSEIELDPQEYGMAVQLQALEDLIWIANGRKGARPDLVAAAMEQKRLSPGRPAAPSKSPAEIDRELEKLIADSKRKK